MARMSIDRICLPPRSVAASMVVSVAAGLLYLWSVGGGTGAMQASSTPAAVLVSVSLLDMSRLAPAQFGDWEPAVSHPGK